MSKLRRVTQTSRQRERAWAAYERALLDASSAGHSQTAIAAAAGVSQQNVSKLLRRIREENGE